MHFYFDFSRQILKKHVVSKNDDVTVYIEIITALKK